jgi:hypothetical protein
MPTVELVERRQHDAPRRCCMSKDGVEATSAAPAVEPVERRVDDTDAPRPRSATQDVGVSSDASVGACRARNRCHSRAATEQHAPRC